MMTRIVKVVSVGVLGCLGCGDKSPSEKCEDLFSSVCDRAVECIPGASGMHRECVQAFDQLMVCGSTKSVAPSYDRCMDLIDQGSCQALFPTGSGSADPTIVLPTECMGVLLMQRAHGNIVVGDHAIALPVAPLGGVIARARAVTE